MKQITFDEYLKLYNIAKDAFKDVVYNVTEPTFNKDTLYLKSKEGCSCITNGLLSGLFRFKSGNEQLAKIHQKYRIENGGYYLECYEGVLSDIYKKQGFKTVAKVKFNSEYAVNGWENNSVLKHSPDIVFMSLYGVNKVETFNDYDKAEKIAIQTI